MNADAEMPHIYSYVYLTVMSGHVAGSQIPLAPSFNANTMHYAKVAKVHPEIANTSLCSLMDLSFRANGNPQQIPSFYIDSYRRGSDADIRKSEMGSVASPFASQPL